MFRICQGKTLKSVAEMWNVNLRRVQNFLCVFLGLILCVACDYHRNFDSASTDNLSSAGELYRVKELLSSPQKFDKKWICVKGQFNSMGAVTLREENFAFDESYYDRALLVETEDEKILQRFDEAKNGEAMTLCGRISVDKDCWDYWIAAQRGVDTDICVPFARPVYFDVSEIVD